VEHPATEATRHTSQEMDAWQRQERVVTACRLLGAGPVRLLANWAEPLEHHGFAFAVEDPGLTRPVSQHLGSLGEQRVYLSEESQLPVLYARLTAAGETLSGKKRAALGLAVRRFGSTYDRVTDDDRLIDAWIALEALFLPDGNQELTYRAAMRMARFLGADSAERKELKRRLGTLYGSTEDARRWFMGSICGSELATSLTKRSKSSDAR
jgi:hypothetical protein